MIIICGPGTWIVPAFFSGVIYSLRFSGDMPQIPVQAQPPGRVVLIVTCFCAVFGWPGGVLKFGLGQTYRRVSLGKGGCQGLTQTGSACTMGGSPDELGSTSRSLLWVQLFPRPNTLQSQLPVLQNVTLFGNRIVAYVIN